MRRNCHASGLLPITVLLTLLAFLQPSTSNPVPAFGDHNDAPEEVLPRLEISENTGLIPEIGRLATKEQTDKEEELFEGVDPKRLAAVLLEALNQTYVRREEDEEEYKSTGEEAESERENIEKEEPYSTRATRDRKIDRQRELEMYIASQGKEREREEEEEKKKALEEEEKITEKVTSHTTSQTIPIQTKQQSSTSDGTAEGGAASQGTSNPEQNSDEDEEQLNPEELKSLETMMKEFPRLDTKRDGISEQRYGRGYSSYNDILPTNKGSNLAMTKKKLKWQEETQKAIYFPTFTGGNSVEEPEYSEYIGKATQPPSPAEQEEEQDEGAEDDEEEDEPLSPEEEEAQAKVEQEEMMRQAAEAQKAKMEEEKLADIASDMLLSYMVKQNKGEKKHSLSLANAAEDKRSDEEQEVAEEDDIDPQTIDKLIEISSKLHLPADDVVDIIADVEKKKKKDVPPEMALLRQHTSSPSLHSSWPFSTNQNSLPMSKQPSPAVNILKAWFADKNTPKSYVSQAKLPKPLLPYRNFSPKPEKPFLVKQGPWFKSPKPVWTGHSLYPYAYHQRKPYLGYYPYYIPRILRPKPKYYMPKPALTLNSYLGNSMEDPYGFPPIRRYPPQLRKSPLSLQHKSFYSTYYPQISSQAFQRIPTSRIRSQSQTVPQQKQFLISAVGPPVIKNKGYFKDGKQLDSSIHDDVERYIQQILMNRAQRLD
ncbi:neurosecretory protein VGF [Cyprinodon tularosa]|uniref:neurosecretory protein VGF n=1 Tax=Cyprinodon tularosa TaxID=77115 RepID=UPI0018E212BA|nr:neurosecretory protein VGF [Cyprinodon tularosa]